MASASREQSPTDDDGSGRRVKHRLLLESGKGPSGTTEDATPPEEIAAKVQGSEANASSSGEPPRVPTSSDASSDDDDASGSGSSSYESGGGDDIDSPPLRQVTPTIQEHRNLGRPRVPHLGPTVREAAQRGKMLKRIRLRCLWDPVHSWYMRLTDFQRARLGLMGFGHFLCLKPSVIHNGLLEAVSERWNPASCTIITSVGEFLPSLEDLVRLIGTHINGHPLQGSVRPNYRADCIDCFGIDQRGNEQVGHVKNACLEAKFGHIDYNEPGVGEDRQLRAFLFFTFGRLFFANNMDRNQCHFLEPLQDLERIQDYARGAAMLAFLYSQLTQAAEGARSLGGFLPFVQLWTWEHFDMFRSILRDNADGSIPFPRGQRWYDRTFPSEAIIRGQCHLGCLLFEELTMEKVVWRPYLPEEHRYVPGISRVGCLYTVDIWLQYYSFIMPHLLSQALLQLGASQRIPAEPPKAVWKTMKGEVLGTTTFSIERFFGIGSRRECWWTWALLLHLRRSGGDGTCKHRGMSQFHLRRFIGESNMPMGGPTLSTTKAGTTAGARDSTVVTCVLLSAPSLFSFSLNIHAANDVTFRFDQCRSD